MNISLLPGTFAVARLDPLAPLPGWASLPGDFVSTTITREELSVVCPMSRVPEGVMAESPWRILKVEGPLDFGLVGIIAKISTALASASISLFTISTFDTDYILVKEAMLGPSIDSLRGSGFIVDEKRGSTIA